MADQPTYKSWQIPPSAASESHILGWIDDACGEGVSWIRNQRGYRDYRKALDTLSGMDTLPTPAASYRSKLNPNRLKRNIREVVAAMAKLRPFWGYHTENKAFKAKAEMMNKVTRAWYLESFADRSVKEALQYAAGTGRGWIHPIYRRDMYGTGEGDIKLLTFGAPCVIPTQLPSSGDWQSAYAVTILDEWPVAMAHGMFPLFQDRLVPSSSRFWYSNDNIRKSAQGNWWSRAFKMAAKSGDVSLPDLYVPIRKTYIIDLSVNTTKTEIPMGDPGTTWSYTVPYIGQEIPAGTDMTGKSVFRKADANDARLYPYRRLVISSDRVKLYDGPAFDWHGMFPGISFCPDSWPWEPLGFSLVHDGYEINESIKEIYRGNMDKVRVQLDMPLAFDTNVTSMKQMKAFDPMQPRARFGYDGSSLEGPPCQPAVPMEVMKVEPESMAMIEKLENTLDSQMAINDVQALAQARSIGSMDQIEKIMEVKGPIIEDMSRSMEPPMRDMGNMIKFMILQYYTTARVMQIVGADGISPEVFDFEPDSIVPSHMPGEDPSKDSASNKIVRARIFAKNLKFFILPNSLHEYEQMESKLGLVQLMKAGVMIDSQTVADAWQVPNYGTLDGNTVMEKWETEQEQKLQFAARMEALKAALGEEVPGLAAAQAALTPPGAVGPGKPNPEGRPPTGQAAPRLVQKDGGARSTITESR